MFGPFDLFLTVVVHYGLTYGFFFIFILDLYAAWRLWPVLERFGQFKIVVPAFQWFLPVQCGYWWFCSVLDCSGLFKMVGVGSCKTYLFSSPVLASFRCCLMVIASYRWLQPVQNSFACFWMVLANLVWLLIVLYDVWSFWLVLDGSGTLWPDLWIFLHIHSWFICCLTVMASSRTFWPVQDSCACFSMVFAGSMWLLMILFGVGLFWPVKDGWGRFL